MKLVLFTKCGLLGGTPTVKYYNQDIFTNNRKKQKYFLLQEQILSKDIMDFKGRHIFRITFHLQEMDMKCGNM